MIIGTFGWIFNGGMDWLCNVVIDVGTKLKQRAREQTPEYHEWCDS